MPEFVSTFTLTVPSEATARVVAAELAGRGHRLVAVRVVGHFNLDPTSWWYGKPSLRPEFTGWWDVFTVLSEGSSQPAGREDPETVAVREIARRHGGVASGSGGGHATTVLGTFSRVGLVHELTDAEVAQRRAVVAGAALRPVPQPAARLAYRPTLDKEAERAAIAERVNAAGDQGSDAAELGEARGSGSGWGEGGDGEDGWGEGGSGDGEGGAGGAAEGSSGEDLERESDGGGGWEDAGEMLDALFDGAMHQGACYPHTAAAVPDFVALALDERLGDRLRAWVYLDLFEIATVGRRDLCTMADTLHALGRPAVEAPEAVAARRAVAEALPRLLERWDAESEAGRFFLAALIAACPETGGSRRPAIAGLREASAGTSRGATLRLVEALAADDPRLIDDALGDLAVGNADDSPYATVGQRGLSVLEGLLIGEAG